MGLPASSPLSAETELVLTLYKLSQWLWALTCYCSALSRRLHWLTFFHCLWPLVFPAPLLQWSRVLGLCGTVMRKHTPNKPRPPRVALGNSNPAQDSGCHENTEELGESWSWWLRKQLPCNATRGGKNYRDPENLSVIALNVTSLNSRLKYTN